MLFKFIFILNFLFVAKKGTKAIQRFRLKVITEYGTYNYY